MLPTSRPSRRPTVAYWPTPDELATFEKLEALEARRDGRAQVARAKMQAPNTLPRPLIALVSAGLLSNAAAQMIGSYV